MQNDYRKMIPKTINNAVIFFKIIGIDSISLP